jgi:glycine cleavage system H lipoate-binding protein
VTKTDEDYQWVLKHAHGMDVKVSNLSTDIALMALQGPASLEVLQRITKADLSALQYYWFAQTTIHTEHAEAPCIISRTGYTGERGYEIMVARDLAPWIWDELLMAGQPLGIVPHGVAARESLRTEAGYLLNGNDMDAQTNPFEAGLGWVVKLSKDFVGKEALEQIKSRGVSHKLIGLEVQGHQTIRSGYRIYSGEKEIGKVSSGPLSPSLTGRNLGLGYVGVEYAEAGTEIEVEIRDKRCKGRIAAIPFVPRRAKDEPTISTYSPYDLRFAESHVWGRAEDGREDVITLGFSDFGQRSLGDILSVDLPKVGDTVTKGASAGRVDSYRRSLDIISPVTGEVVEVNAALLEHPEQINAYPYARSGVLKVRVARMDEYRGLMRFEEYADLVRRLRRYDQWTNDLRMK